jgi:hypothetical protein
LTGRRDKDILANKCAAKEANMRRGRVFALILVVLLLTSIGGCSSPAVSIPEEPAPIAAPVEDVHDFIIEVTGNKGNKFSGSYMTMMADGSSTSHSVEGVVPATYKTPETDAMFVKYTTRGVIVSCFFQQQGDIGCLIVTILRDGYQVADEMTNAAYGCITIATP